MLAGNPLCDLDREEWSTAQCSLLFPGRTGRADQAHRKKQNLQPKNRQAKILLFYASAVVLYLKPIQQITDSSLYLFDMLGHLAN